MEIGYEKNTPTASGIHIDFVNNLQFTPHPFNGDVFTFDNPVITGVSVTGNVSPIVTFDANHIYINFTGLTVIGGASFVDVTVNATSVPELGSLMK
jgi:hypothetical protein